MNLRQKAQAHSRTHYRHPIYSTLIVDLMLVDETDHKYHVQYYVAHQTEIKWRSFSNPQKQKPASVKELLPHLP